MKGLPKVIGKTLHVRSNKMEPLRGRINKQRTINNRISIVTIRDEFDIEWEIRVPNRVLAEQNQEIPYKGEIYKIY